MYKTINLNIMKKILILTLAVFGLALLPMSAQMTEGPGSYKYNKAIEMLESDGDPDEVMKLLEENIDENPKHIGSYVLMARLERRQRDFASALRYINDAIKYNHKASGMTHAQLLWWKSSIYSDLDDYTQSLAYLQEALKFGKKQCPNLLEDMLEGLAQLYYNMEDYDSSDKVYRELMKLDEASLLPKVGLARNMNAREEFDKALEILNDCLKYNKDYYEVYRFMSAAYEGKKEYKKMIDAMLTLYDKTEDVDYLDMKRFMLDKKYSIAVLKHRIVNSQDKLLWQIVLSNLYEDCGMYIDAIKLINVLVDEFGYDGNVYEQRANCYDELGLTELALADINEVIEKCDKADQAYYYALRAGYYRRGGQYDAAIADYTKFIDQNPTKAYGYYARGWSKELSGDRAGAMADYNDGIAVNEDYPYMYLMRGTLYMEDGDKEKANLDFEQVVAKDTVVSEGTCLHYALHFLGRSEEALDWMNQLVEMYPYDAGVMYDQACLYARMNKCDEAVAALKVAFEKGYRQFVHLEHDNDMDPIRERDDYKALVEQYKKVQEEELQTLGTVVKQEKDKVVSEIDMKKQYGGTYEVACTVNGLPLNMIFDTGASDVTISSVEANFMLKNGYLSTDDIKGKKHYQIASGEIQEGTVITIKELKLGEAVLKNIDASVVHNQRAPLLLGQSVLERFGTITIDNVNSKLLIKQ